MPTSLHTYVRCSELQSNISTIPWSIIAFCLISLSLCSNCSRDRSRTVLVTQGRYTGSVYRFYKGMHWTMSSSGIRFTSSVDPCGRCGRFMYSRKKSNLRRYYSLVVDHFVLIRDTIKSTVAITVLDALSKPYSWALNKKKHYYSVILLISLI